MIQCKPIQIPSPKTCQKLKELGLLPPIGDSVHVYYPQKNGSFERHFGSFDSDGNFNTNEEYIPIPNAIFAPTTDQLLSLVDSLSSDKKRGYVFGINEHMENNFSEYFADLVISLLQIP